MSSLRQRRLFGCQLVAGWPLIVSNRLGENEPITSLTVHQRIHLVYACRTSEKQPHLQLVKGWSLMLMLGWELGRLHGAKV
jgi:hypothetical protein